MIYPNIWGNGALFAFSGIEGTNTLKDSMCGQLMSKHIGIAFDSHRVEMYLRLKEVSDFSFEAVASDVITKARYSSATFSPCPRGSIIPWMTE